MEIKIVIIRKISEDQQSFVEPLLLELHTLAWKSEGYISGETLISVENPEERIVVSSWKSYDDWDNYRNNESVKELHSKVDQILGKPTKHRIYRHK